MIYDGVIWIFRTLGKMLEFLLSIKIINGISMLEISLGITVAAMLIKFLKFGFEDNNSISIVRTSRGMIENSKQKRIDRIESLNRQKLERLNAGRHEKGAIKHGGRSGRYHK